MFNKIHPSWCVVTLTLGVVAGTALAVFGGWTWMREPLWLVAGGLGLAVALCFPTRVTLGLALVAGLSLAQYRAALDLDGQKLIQPYLTQTVELSGKVIEDPDTDDSKTALRLNELNINGEAVGGVIYVQMSKNAEIKRSDQVILSGTLAEGFGTFAASMYRPTIVEIKRVQNEDVMLGMRDNFADAISAHIPEDEAKLGLAYLLGMKSGLSDDLTEILRVVGLVHIVVASGTHMSILVGVARRVFGKVSRFAGLVGALGLVLGFGGIVGWTASITRAALVSGLAVTMWYVGRKFEAWRLILIVMAITLIINPMYMMNLGWQLSFSAFGGILILEPVMAQWLYGERKPSWIAETLMATIAATVTCLPVSLYCFGTVSLISLLANLLILPTMPYVMGLVFATGVMGFWPLAAEGLGKIATWALDYHLLVIRILGEQKMFLIEIAPQNPWVFVLYVPIAGILIYATIKKWKSNPNKNLSNTERDWLMV